ncbi:hypothetical protein K435DRAFT_799971 [Dendrothele bispora CBS 962.96]|uniref:Helicase C-terminal domain-containing protein n=1 Tax=Dendrothele bispora (strain CBS 962.96) TaxID=1314807 RepID=A0A4S8LU72_DENBC|nr:hypothetical protein K435DRAFT_799971 [Dendrothele bispora CBS 962.96]
MQDVLHMLGRAGRPQYDTHGEGIIITNHSELQYYLRIERKRCSGWDTRIYRVLYSIGVNYLKDDPSLIQKRADIVHSAAVLLEKCQLVKYERLTPDDVDLGVVQDVCQEETEFRTS